MGCMKAMNFECLGKTDIGLSRTTNQDFYGIYPQERLFFVADGMGGHSGGEVASTLCVETFYKILSERLKKNHTISEKDFYCAIEETNNTIASSINKTPTLIGMGTTLVGLYIDEDHALVINIGDSRLYHHRHGALIQVTTDHSLVQEHINKNILTATAAKTAQYKNILTRAIGRTEHSTPDFFSLPLQKDDILLLCSDGLHGPFNTDSEIEDIITRHIHSLDSIMEALFASVYTAGARDNITAVLIRIT